MQVSLVGGATARARVVSLLLVLLLSPLLLASNAVDAPAGTLPEVAPEDVGFSAERLARITPAMQSYVDRGEVAGVVTLIARKGKIAHFEAVGSADAEAGRAMTRDTIFRIASMTKPITSVALMMLWEEGHFQLRDPVAKFMPEFADPTIAVAASPEEYVATPYKQVPSTRPITIQHLLTHTAGLANTYRGLTRPDYARYSQAREAGDTVGDDVERLAELPLNFTPGTAWEYGPATNVAGHLVEVISGMTLDEFFRTKIFEPLGMDDTHFFLPEEKLGRFSALYRPGQDGKIELTEAPTAESRWLRQPQVYFAGGGGLVSTAIDYARFHQMMLNGGELDGVRILGRKTVELMTRNHIGDLDVWLRGPGYGFGLGYSVVTDMGRSGMPASEGTYAWGGAFCTTFWVDPEEEIVGVLMTQVRPYTHLNIRQDVVTLTYQALVD